MDIDRAIARLSLFSAVLWLIFWSWRYATGVYGRPWELDVARRHPDRCILATGRTGATARPGGPESECRCRGR